MKCKALSQSYDYKPNVKLTKLTKKHFIFGNSNYAVQLNQGCYGSQKTVTTNY